jgi:hypothetical protein
MLGLGHLHRLVRAAARRGGVRHPTPEETVQYEGRIYLEPSDAYFDGRILLLGEGNLVDYLYRALPVPSDDLGVHVHLYGRITIEVLPDPDLNGWP